MLIVLVCRAGEWECGDECAMVSRRAILSRSRDDLTDSRHTQDSFSAQPEDQWFSKEKLYKVCIICYAALDCVEPTL